MIDAGSNRLALAASTATYARRRPWISRRETRAPRLPHRRRLPQAAGLGALAAAGAGVAHGQEQTSSAAQPPLRVLAPAEDVELTAGCELVIPGPQQQRLRAAPGCGVGRFVDRRLCQGRSPRSPLCIDAPPRAMTRLSLTDYCPATVAASSGSRAHLESCTRRSLVTQRKSQPEVPAVSIADQTLADLDQSGADSDQTTADSDQTAADSDQAAANSDQRAADQDQFVSDRILADGGDTDAHRATSDVRSRTSEQREETAQTRLQSGGVRDAVARQRDLAAAGRDEKADQRDELLAARDAGPTEDDRPMTGASLLARAARDRRRAAADRAAAAEGRASAARDRARAAVDRTNAADDRLQAETDRDLLLRRLDAGIGRQTSTESSLTDRVRATLREDEVRHDPPINRQDPP